MYNITDKDGEPVMSTIVAMHYYGHIIENLAMNKDKDWVEGMRRHAHNNKINTMDMTMTGIICMSENKLKNKNAYLTTVASTDNIEVEGHYNVKNMYLSTNKETTTTPSTCTLCPSPRPRTR